ncbi:hypothetical protein FOCC_FOCC015250 [Frankliniella occidentalis]|nr:hypothetical protein FOCC_FOCC015250 [Frankliniella occidentalis]
MKTPGDKKTRFTVVLTVAADGKKFPPYEVFLPKDKFPTGIHVGVRESGSFNEDITTNWLRTGTPHRSSEESNKAPQDRHGHGTQRPDKNSSAS